MSASPALTPSRSHARPSRIARLVSLFRGHDDIPEAPDADFQDHGDGMDITEALDALDEFPGYDPEAWRKGRPPAAEQAHEPRGETLVDIHAHAPRRFVAPGARWPDAGPEPQPEQDEPRLSPVFERPAPPPLPADTAIQMARVLYPLPGAPREQWTEVMRQVSAATGTRGTGEDPAEWPAGRGGHRAVPALDVARVTLAGDGLHRAALEAPPAVRRLAITAPAVPPDVTEGSDEDAAAERSAA
jgi:hypothetical protein